MLLHSCGNSPGAGKKRLCCKGSSSREQEEKGAGSRAQLRHAKCLYWLQTVLWWECCQDVEMQAAHRLNVCLWTQRREQQLCSSLTQTRTRSHPHSKMSHGDCCTAQLGLCGQRCLGDVFMQGWEHVCQHPPRPGSSMGSWHPAIRLLQV